MEIKIEDLKIGDEILICCQTAFKRLRVKTLPTKNKDGYWKRIKFDIRNENIVNKGKPGAWANYNFSNPDYNDTFSMDLSGRDIWLINRKAI